MNIGDKIKRLRLKMNLTQEDLANRCELSKGFISQVERDLTSPSIATLLDILESLGTNINDFFNEKDEYKIVFHKDDMFVKTYDEQKLTINWIVPNAQKNKMEPILLNLYPGGRTSTYNPYDGEMFGYVLKGFVRLHIDDKILKLKTGESFYYKPETFFYLDNSSKNEVTVLMVSNPPVF